MIIRSLLNLCLALLISLSSHSIIFSQTNFNWFQIWTGGNNVFISGMQFINSNTGYRLTGWGNGHYNNGSISKTTNGGLNWIQSAGSPIIPLHTLNFLNEHTGWVTGGYWDDAGKKSREIFYTTNGGSSFTRQFLDSVSNATLRSISFINSNTGWISTNGTELFRTTNAGVNWIIINDIPLGIGRIYFINTLTGYAGFPSPNGYYKTTNGGYNWQVINISPGATLMDICFINSSTGFISTDSGKVYRTTNSGSSWLQSAKLPLKTNRFSFIDQQRGWLSADSAKIFYTSNSGFNWVTLSSGLNFSTFNYNLFWIQFTDQQTGYLITSTYINLISNYYIYKTTNGGGIVGINPISNELPGEYKLYQNYPNPFNPTTKIKFNIPHLTKGGTKGGLVPLNIYNSLGQLIETLVNESTDGGLSPGTYEVEWNGINNPSGIYFYKLIVHDPTVGSVQVFLETKKMLLIK